MTWRDVSITVHPGTAEWPGDTPFSCGWAWQISQGNSVNVSEIRMSPHVGTHADAPLHVADGAAGSHELPIDAFIGRSWVTDVRDCRDAIPLSALALPESGPIERLLLRTGRGVAAGTFPATWPVLDPDAIRALLARGLRLVGVDAPSVDARDAKDLRTHHAIFGGQANVLENLDLRDVAAGPYELIALPLRLQGLDAAPVRAILRPLADR